jgi:prepilin-type N-terminal cleavage/methylation domain-containing protein
MKIRRSSTKSARSRRGISLVEVIVALAVIAIISTAALSLVISSARVDANSLRSTQVMMAAENALECYRFAENEEEFAALLGHTGDYIEADDSYVLTESSYAITVKYEDDSLRFTAIDSDGKVIYDYEFNKG